MTKRRKILLLLASLVLAFGAYMLLKRETEPTYKGKPLSDWVRQPGSHNPWTWPDAEQSEAIKEIGTKAVPFLLRWMEYEKPDWRTRVDGFCGEHRMLRWVATMELGKEERGYGAALAWKALGPEGKIAIPGLARLLNSPSDACSWRAALALAGLIPDGLPSLLVGLSSTNATLRAKCAQAIGHGGPKAAQALQSLIQCLNDPDTRVRQKAASAIGHLQTQPALAIQALTNAFTDPDPVVRAQAVVAAGWFGKEAFITEARVAVPSLAQALRDKDAYVRRSAAGALRRFGREAASAVPYLQRVLLDPDAAVESEAKSALLQIAPEALTNAPPR